MPIRSDEDVVRLRTTVRQKAVDIGLSLVDQTKLITAASELARNALRYGGGGYCQISLLADGLRKGMRLRFVDQGPGIADVAQALTDGYSSGNGMGLGLGGAKRLVDAFDIVTAAGQGTTVTVCKWTR